MSTELTILPMKYTIGQSIEIGFILTNGQIEMASNHYDFFDRVENLESKEIPVPVAGPFGEDGAYEETMEDRLGNKLRMVSARDFASLINTKGISRRMRAALAYCAVLDDDDMIILYWS